MTDRELLEAAAKAAGLRIEYWAADNYPVVLDEEQRKFGWNPLVYESDAFRLAVELQMLVGPNSASRDPMVFARAQDGVAHYEPVGSSGRAAATRRAITRAAAAIGSVA